jgi:endoglucanase
MKFLSASLVALGLLSASARAQDDLLELPTAKFSVYNSWKDAAEVVEGESIKVVADARGGLLVNGPFDYSASKDRIPAVQLTPLNGNGESRLRLILRDGDGTSCIWNLDIKPGKPDESQIALAASAATLSHPHKVEKPGTVEGLDLAKITQLHIQGSYKKDVKLALALSRVLVQADAQDGAQQRAAAAEVASAEQAKLEAKKKADAEKAEALRAKLASSKADFYEITPVSDRVVAVYFREGWVDHEPPAVKGRKWDDESRLHLARLNTPLADTTDAWTMTSPDDPAYSSAVRPTSVGRKSKGADFLRRHRPSLDDHVVREHWMFLSFDAPMQPGRTYEIDLSSLARNAARATLKFDPLHTRSDSVHVNQLGFAPAAPKKIAYVSQFMGTAGRLSLGDAARKFHLVDQSSGQIVFTGDLSLRKKFDGQPDSGRPAGEEGPGNNLAGSDVWECDFSSFNTPGEYVVSVDGVGCSYPFQIAPDVYRQAYVTVGRAIYHTRAGVAKTAPYTRWAMPRDHHPDDGFVAHFDDGTPYKTWGWYHDAADFDPYPSHSRIASTLLLAYQVAPKKFSDGELNIPESGNGVPDILDTAEWQVQFMRRSVGPTGGVIARMDFGPKKPPMPCAAWEDKTTWKAWPADADSTFRFVAIAAEFVYTRDLAKGGKQPDSDAILADAVRQYQWAQSAYETEIAGPLTDQNRNRRGTLLGQYAFAAVALYKATGDDSYQQTFKSLNPIRQATQPIIARNGNHMGAPAADNWDLEEAVYSYVLIDPADPRSKSLDTALQNTLKQAVANWARYAVVEPAERRSFRAGGYLWTMPHATGQATTPDVLDALIAWRVTGDETFRTAAQLSADYCLGGNPSNTFWITGLGDRPPEQVMHINSWHLPTTEVLPGLIPYGPKREGDRNDTWFDGTWDNDFGRNTAYPHHKQWPIAELYFENRYNPQGNEFTVWQNLAPAMAVYGLLSDDASANFVPNQLPSATLKTSTTDVVAGQHVTLEATAADADGRVTRVRFFNGKQFLGESTAEPFAITWTPSQPGRVQLSAVAVDNLGARTLSLDQPRVDVEIRPAQ